MPETPAESEETVQDVPQSAEASIIETFQSIVVAFILAFAFRSVVIEAFVIPTGSMAPTLLGAHVMARSPQTGYTFPVGPRDTDNNIALPTQGTKRDPIDIADPMLDRIDRNGRGGNSSIQFVDERTRMGDRILVLKYLYSLFGPSRFDVVVFKNPKNPAENYIKRLIGLPGERVWLCDGDVFVSVEDDPSGTFLVQRKPEHVQRRVWQPVYHSKHIPIQSNLTVVKWTCPWEGKGWVTENVRSYRQESDDPTTLKYREAVRPIRDAYAYNTSANHAFDYFNVADMRFATGIAPDASGLNARIELACRNHVFECVLSGDTAELRMRPEGGSEWTVLGSGSIDAFEPGRVTNVEFWHVDQQLWLWINGKMACDPAPYEWDGRARSINATGLTPEQAASSGGRPHQYLDYNHRPQETRLALHFEGSALTLHRVELDRDLYYQPTRYGRNGPVGTAALATHPSTVPTLGPDHFFVCGDNSPSSLDGRLWGDPNPWIAATIDDGPGVVHRDLMMGKAFFVYFPSPEGLSDNGSRFIPNFGQMRFIH